jgi:hypothetical protein
MIEGTVVGIFLVLIGGMLALAIADFLINREWRFTWIRDDKTYKIESVIIMYELDMVILKMREKGTKRKYYLKCKIENGEWLKERRYKG